MAGVLPLTLRVSATVRGFARLRALGTPALTSSRLDAAERQSKGFDDFTIFDVRGRRQITVNRDIIAPVVQEQVIRQIPERHHRHIEIFAPVICRKLSRSKRRRHKVSAAGLPFDWIGINTPGQRELGIIHLYQTRQYSIRPALRDKTYAPYGFHDFH